MITDRRPGYATFLTRRAAVPDHKIRYYVHWVQRFLAFVPPAVDPREAVPRFLDLLGREKEPWQVEQAKEAIQRYVLLRAEPHTAGGSPAAAPDWDALLAEVARVPRLKHLSVRAERSYLGWLRRFEAFMDRPSPATLSSAHRMQQNPPALALK